LFKYWEYINIFTKSVINMRRTKIVCTIGPSCESPDMLVKLAFAGMNIARLNFSHGDYEEHQKRVDAINNINKKISIPISIMLDTQGPEIRTGTFKDKVILQDGAEVILTTRDVICDEKVISVSYKKITETVKKGDLIFIVDGAIELVVEKVSGTDVYCKINVGGEVGTKKNVNIPGAYVDLPSISDKDREDIKWGAKNKMDFVAQSFVKSVQDVRDMKALIKECGSDAHLIAKIEAIQALDDIDEIIEEADGIMVARGDLGVQIPIEQVPRWQKSIIKKCNEAGKPVIVATQMLESMTKNPRPTRAEVTDIANAVLDGADAVMLSGETANGKYPLRAVEMMVKVVEKTEEKMEFMWLSKTLVSMKTEDALSRSVCQTAYDLNASAIITCTSSGHTARLVSKHRPQTRIIAVTPNTREIKKLNLCWGVHALRIPEPESTDSLINSAIDTALEHEYLKKGDTIVLTAGIPFHIPGNINLMKVHDVE